MDVNLFIQIVVGIIILSITLLITFLLKFLFYKLVNLFSRKWAGLISTLVASGILVLGTYFITLYTSIDIKAFYALLGLVAAGVSFGITDFSSKLFNSFKLLGNDYYSVGDYIKVDGFEGRVTHITTQNTTLITRENDTIVIPNETILSTSIINRNSNGKFIVTIKLPLQSTNIIQSEKDIGFILLNIVKRKNHFLNIGFVRLEEIGEDAFIWSIGLVSENSWFAKDSESDLLKSLTIELQSLGYEVGYSQEMVVRME